MIGRGAYGRVFEVDYQGTLCAAKEIHSLLLQYSPCDAIQKIRTDFLNECQVWSTLHHPRIVQFLGTFVNCLQITQSHDHFRSILSITSQFTCDCDGKDATQPQGSFGELQQHTIECQAFDIA